MFLFGLDKGPSGLDPLLLLLAAFLLDVALGPALSARKLSVHPLNGLGELVAWLDRKLNRERRSAVDRAIRGGLMVLALVVLAGLLGWGLAWLARAIPHGFLLELLAIVLLIDQRAVHDQVRRVGAALSRDNPRVARDELAALSGSDDTRQDAHAVARTAIEIAARSFAFGVVAPTFWYALFGLPGLVVLRAIAVIDDVIGEPSDRHRAFGFTATRLNEVMVLVPAPLAGLFILIASLFVPTAKPGRAVRAMLERAGPYRSRAMGWPVGAMAGALGLALAGPRRQASGVAQSPWVDAGTARASPLDVRRALFLLAVACLINGAWVAAIAVARLI
jgi:adenosylcobinamide-phosphate synthase